MKTRIEIEHSINRKRRLIELYEAKIRIMEKFIVETYLEIRKEKERLREIEKNV
jgi:hypothetical protein